MTLQGRQFRFVSGAFLLWIALRLLFLSMGSGAGLGGVGLMGRYLPDPIRWWRPAALQSIEPTGDRSAKLRSAVLRQLTSSRLMGVLPQTSDPSGDGPVRKASDAIEPRAEPAPKIFYAATEKGADAAPLTSEALSRPAKPRSRWSGSAYVFVRPGSGAASLAAGGELGGSQAAARLSYQLNPDGPVRTAVAARLYAPLGQKGAEAAVGLDWYPMAGVPVRVSVERRFDLDGKGRSAWSAYAAGGFYLDKLHGTVAVDGYAQAGVVGAERHDLFVDGALRVGRRWPVGDMTVTAVAGLWGAAQPEVARLDVGPRLAATVPVETHNVTLAVEGRLRIAGDAHPGSGAALTLAVDL
jgi:hypothetical protein